MDRNELRDEIVEWLNNETALLEVECEAAGDGLISLLAPVIEKAERWDAYQTDLINEKAHTERFIKLMDAEEDELRADAEKWRKVVEIAKRIWMDDPCEDCPVEKRCNPCNCLCGQAYSVVDALKEDPMTIDELLCNGDGKIRSKWAREEG